MNKCLKTCSKIFLLLVFLSILPGILAAQEFTSKGADTCLMCHRSDQEAVMPLFNTMHGSRTDPDAPFSNQQCESCHGLSNAHFKAKNKKDPTKPDW